MRYTVRDLIISAIVLVVLVSGVVLVRNRTPDTAPRAASPDTAHPITISPQPPLSSTMTVHSPDGTEQLVLKEVEDRTGTQSAYVLTASDVSGANRRIIYQSVAPNGTNVRIPANSWSPDNKFVFIIAIRNEQLTVFVFQANGEAFADGSPYIDVSSLFRDRLPTAILRDVTGWDDPSLLHVMTYTADKTLGPSYWFDIWSKSFIELARR